MTTSIAVMTKAPRAGFSKTRLMPHLTADEAATLSAAFLQDITSNLAEAAHISGIVPYAAYAPPGSEDLLRPFLAPGTRLILADGSMGNAPNVVGFGRCLLQAIRGMLDQGHAAACVLNADSPTLPNRLLLAAHTALAEADCIVMGEAEDGGYYLLGMRAAHSGMFSNIEWSTPRVAIQTRQRAAEFGLPVVELEPLYDVDDLGSLKRLVDEINKQEAGSRGSGAFIALHTRECVDRLALRSRLASSA